MAPGKSRAPWRPGRMEHCGGGGRADGVGKNGALRRSEEETMASAPSRRSSAAVGEEAMASRCRGGALRRSGKRRLRRAVGEELCGRTGIEREIGTLQSEEKKLVAEIKRTAKTGNEAATKILARQLIRLRQQITSLQGSRAQMRGIATHTQAMHANTSIAVGMQGAAKAMGAVNKQMAPAKQAKLMQEFQRQSAQMDMTSEMISDSIDDALDNDEAEEETEDVTNQVLDEIGVDIASQLASAPKGRIAAKKTEDIGSYKVDELERRMAALRNP